MALQQRKHKIILIYTYQFVLTLMGQLQIGNFLSKGKYPHIRSKIKMFKKLMVNYLLKFHCFNHNFWHISRG